MSAITIHHVCYQLNPDPERGRTEELSRIHNLEYEKFPQCVLGQDRDRVEEEERVHLAIYKSCADTTLWGEPSDDLANVNEIDPSGLQLPR